MAKRILVVEDDEATRGLLELVLRESGYAVEQARDGVEALEAVKRIRPDLIVLDKQLPRMNGTEFAKAYRALPGDHAPIVALCAAIDCPAWSASIGAVATLMKPFAIDELTGMVREQIAATSVASPVERVRA
jgi:DNA-binding response OmpR family regulator